MKKCILILISVFIILMMIFGNRKVRIAPVFGKFFSVLKNAKTNRFSFWDFVCFNVFPVVLSCIIVFGFDCVIDESLASVLTEVFATVFTVLFGFAAILAGKMESKNAIEKRVVNETFISIMTATLLALLSSVLSIVLIKTSNQILIYVFSLLVYSSSLIMLMDVLMISKRIFIIYSDNE